DGDPFELFGRADGEAARERFRHHRPAFELVTKARRQDDPPLRVERVLVFAEEHVASTTCTFRTRGYAASARPYPPLRSPLCHFPPHRQPHPPLLPRQRAPGPRSGATATSDHWSQNDMGGPPATIGRLVGRLGAAGAGGRVG